jgi:hypothetical protein
MADGVADDAAGQPTTVTARADDSGSTVSPPRASQIVRSAPARPAIRTYNWGSQPPKLPRIHYLETNKHWLNVRWLLMTMPFDLMNSSYYLNDIDIRRRVYTGTASILKRLPIRRLPP